MAQSGHEADVLESSFAKWPKVFRGDSEVRVFASGHIRSRQ
jgi:hypothetical protein